MPQSHNILHIPAQPSHRKNSNIQQQDDSENVKACNIQNPFALYGYKISTHEQSKNTTYSVCIQLPLRGPGKLL